MNTAPLSKDALASILCAKSLEELESTFEKARQARQAIFGNTFFMYGFLYVSTYCRNNCTFCQYRRSNTALERYRKHLDELLLAGKRLADDGVHLLDITLGEDPYYVTEHGFERLLQLVRTIKETTGLPVMVSPGVLTAAQLVQLAEAGADWYACYQETYNRDLFARLRCEQDFDQRQQARHDAAMAGLLPEDGLLTGVGETCTDLTEAILSMQRAPLAQVRAMSYVPSVATFPSTAGHTLEARRLHELKAIAAMRLLMPERLIPASLDVDGLEGLHMRVNAGANVVTSLVPSGYGFAGVASRELDIENQRRSVRAVCAQLHELGLHASSHEAFTQWMTTQKAHMQAHIRSGA